MKYLSKNRISLLFFIVAFLGVSCKKEISKTDYWGSVRHYYTKAPINGIGILMTHGHGSGLFGSSVTEGSVLTNAEGIFHFRLNKVRKDVYSIETIQSVGTDSTVDGARFKIDSYFEKIDKDIHPVIELKPAGDLSIYLSDSSWSVLPADTFVIESVYDRDTLFRGKLKWKEFWVEPSKVNKFIWYGVKNRAKVFYEEKYVFAPNANFHVTYGQIGYRRFGYWINLGR